LLCLGSQQAALRLAPEELALEPLVLPLQLGSAGLQRLVLLQQRDYLGLAQARGPVFQRHAAGVSLRVPAAKLDPIEHQLQALRV
jgi:hypothetical protein